VRVQHREVGGEHGALQARLRPPARGRASSVVALVLVRAVALLDFAVAFAVAVYIGFVSIGVSFPGLDRATV
jgi:hypothetical protein